MKIPKLKKNPWNIIQDASRKTNSSVESLAWAKAMKQVPPAGKPMVLDYQLTLISQTLTLMRITLTLRETLTLTLTLLQDYTINYRYSNDCQFTLQ